MERSTHGSALLSPDTLRDASLPYFPRRWFLRIVVSLRYLYIAIFETETLVTSLPAAAGGGFDEKLFLFISTSEACASNVTSRPSNAERLSSAPIGTANWPCGWCMGTPKKNPGIPKRERNRLACLGSMGTPPRRLHDGS